jgi:hypothetical protein
LNPRQSGKRLLLTGFGPCGFTRDIVQAWRKTLIALLLFPAAAFPADEWFRGTFTGKELLTACKAAAEESIKDFERGVCRGFIEGYMAGRYIGDISHAMHHRNEKFEDIPGALCVPKDINKTVLAVVFVQFLEKNPDKLGWNAGVLFESALKLSFPCPK